MKHHSHYYLLPDGRKAANMRDGCHLLAKGTNAFRSLVRKEIIKKVITKNQKLKSHEKINNN